MKIKDKHFVPFIDEATLFSAVQRVAQQISLDYADRKPMIVAVLNGAFMFAADLIRQLDIEVEITFVKVKSYQGTQSSGNAKQLIGLEESLEGKDIILLEDIVDTGHTIQHLLDLLNQQKPVSISVATLLFKPEALQQAVDLQYVGIEIPNLFVVGYGLDYDGFGRQYKAIYQLAE